jgi:hypothetical protein
MTKKTTETETMSNPFSFDETETTETKSRELSLTPQLVSVSNDRARNLIKTVGNKPELHDLANQMLDAGNVLDLLDLIQKVYTPDDIQSDAKFMEGADKDELSRMLESRRSDRSKSKKAGLRHSINNTVTYISSMYAELMIRSVTGKPYTGSSTTTSTDIESIKDDRAAIDRKIKSLQSKKSRLNRIAQYDPAAKKELDSVIEDIDRLNQFRGNTRTSAKVVIRDAGLENVREALTGLQADNSVDEQTRDKIAELLKKIG